MHRRIEIILRTECKMVHFIRKVMLQASSASLASSAAAFSESAISPPMRASPSARTPINVFGKPRVPMVQNTDRLGIVVPQYTSTSNSLLAIDCSRCGHGNPCAHFTGPQQIARLQCKQVMALHIIEPQSGFFQALGKKMGMKRTVHQR